MSNTNNSEDGQWTVSAPVNSLLARGRITANAFKRQRRLFRKNSNSIQAARWTEMVKRLTTSMNPRMLKLLDNMFDEYFKDVENHLQKVAEMDVLTTELNFIRKLATEKTAQANVAQEALSERTAELHILQEALSNQTAEMNTKDKEIERLKQELGMMKCMENLLEQHGESQVEKMKVHIANLKTWLATIG